MIFPPFLEKDPLEVIMFGGFQRLLTFLQAVKHTPTLQALANKEAVEEDPEMLLCLCYDYPPDN